MLVASTNTKSSFLAGTAKAKITPPLGSLMNGEFFPRTANKIHDELYVKAVFLKTKKTAACVVIVDNCSLPFDFIEMTKAGINAATGLQPSNVLIAATHAHSCGSTMASFLSTTDFTYTNGLITKIVDVVKEASSNLVGAHVAFGKSDVPDYIFCRRYRMKEGVVPFTPIGEGPDRVVTNPVGLEDKIVERSGTVDTELSFMAIKSDAGEWISILANYSLHYVGDFDGDTISADYFGLFANALEERIKTPGFVAILSNGTSANANNWDFLNPDNESYKPFEKSKKIAGDLAERIYDQLALLEWNENADLNVLYEEKVVPVRKPSAELLRQSHEFLKNADFNSLKSTNNDTLQKIYSRELVLLSEEKDWDFFPLQAFKIGHGIIGALPGEIFGSTGIEIKKAAQPLNYFSISMANAYVGYIVPMREMQLGGYETWLCRHSKLDTNSEITLKETMFQFIGRLKEKATCQ